MPKDEPPLHYFVSGLDVWRSSQGAWPPESTPQLLYLSQAALELRPPGAGAPLDFEVDFTATTGTVSRWNLVAESGRRPSAAAS